MMQPAPSSLDAVAAAVHQQLLQRNAQHVDALQDVFHDLACCQGSILELQASGVQSSRAWRWLLPLVTYEQELVELLSSQDAGDAA